MKMGKYHTLFSTLLLLQKCPPLALCLNRGQEQLPAYSCGSKVVPINVLKFSIQQPKSNIKVTPQPCVVVLDNHEFSTSQWSPFVADNTTNFRPGCQIQNTGGEKKWHYQCPRCMWSCTSSVFNYDQKNLPVAYISTLQSKVTFTLARSDFQRLLWSTLFQSPSNVPKLKWSPGKSK